MPAARIVYMELAARRRSLAPVRYPIKSSVAQGHLSLQLEEDPVFRVEKAT